MSVENQPIRIIFDFGVQLNSPLEIPLDSGGGCYSNCTSSNQSSTSNMSMGDLIDTAERIKRQFPQPTEAQKRFAEITGFPDYPGFIFSPSLARLLRKQWNISQLKVVEYFEDRFNGVPFNVDPKMAGLEYRSAEEEWARLMEIGINARPL